MYAPDWNWHQLARSWNPRTVEQLFQLTREKLRNAYEGLAVSQAECDPLESWYQLTQFVSLRERQRLKGEALKAETLRSGAHMLRLLHKDLYQEELPHSNEVTGITITHVPELEVRKDVRRYMELVTNRFGLNPQPKLALLVEGLTEEIVVKKIFEHCFGPHPGTYGIEIIVLGGVDNATGRKHDRFKAIFRLIDYLHHHQTLTFLILDDEGPAKKLKSAAKQEKSIHHGRRYVTRPDYIKIWKGSFEFANCSSEEIATALTKLSPPGVSFSRNEVAVCKKSRMPGACLKHLYREKAGRDIPKTRLAEILVDLMVSSNQRRINNRPVVKTLAGVARLAARNPLPIMQETWETNQASQHLGKKRP